MKKTFLFLLPAFIQNMVFVYGIVVLQWPLFFIMVGYVIEALFFPIADYLFIFFAKCTYKYKFFLNRSDKYRRMKFIFTVFIFAYLFSIASSHPLVAKFFEPGNTLMFYSAVTSMLYAIVARMIVDVYLRLRESRNVPLQRCEQIKFPDRKSSVAYGTIIIFSVGLFFIRSPFYFAILLVAARLFFETFDFKRGKFVFS